MTGTRSTVCAYFTSFSARVGRFLQEPRSLPSWAAYKTRETVRSLGELSAWVPVTAARPGGCFHVCVVRPRNLDSVPWGRVTPRQVRLLPQTDPFLRFGAGVKLASVLSGRGFGPCLV